jgi:hypothetical protein
MQLTHRARRTKLVAAAASLVTVAAIVATTTSQGSAAPARRAAPQTPASIAGLKVLLTNDDSARAADTQYGTDGRVSTSCARPSARPVPTCSSSRRGASRAAPAAG